MKKYKINILEQKHDTAIVSFKLKDFGFITHFIYTCIEYHADPVKTTEDETSIAFSIQCPCNTRKFIQTLINEQFNPAVIQINWL